MATITITNDVLINARNGAQLYINRNPDRSRLHYALEKFIKKTQSKFEDYQDKENDIRVDCALIDKDTKKFVMEDKNQLAVDPTKAKDLQKRIRDLGRETVDVEPHYATEIPPHLEAMWYQVFNGIIIKEEDDEMAKEPKPEMAVRELEPVNSNGVK